MIVSIHQPAYLPWLGYFEKILKGDLFLFLDTVQFQKGDFQNRNRILTKDGPAWLTVPIVTKGALFQTPLSELRIDNRSVWQRKHLNAIRMNYGNAPKFDAVYPALETILSQEWERLSDLSFAMLKTFCLMLSIKTPLVRTSKMAPRQSSKSELILDLCRETGATRYFSGASGRDYLDEEAFECAGIEIEFQDYAHPVYRQRYAGFTPGMAVIDLLMNEDDPGTVLRGGYPPGEPMMRAAGS